jgi:hypothetical protein
VCNCKHGYASGCAASTGVVHRKVIVEMHFNIILRNP